MFRKDFLHFQKTDCKNMNFADIINNLAGYFLGESGNTYTDLSDEYLLRKGEKFIYLKPLF